MSDYDPNPKAFDKRTLIAVVLSVIVITGFMTVQNIFFPPEPLPLEPAPTAQTQQAPLSSQPAAESAPSIDSLAGLIEAVAPSREQTYIIETDLFRARFTNKGGELLSLVLKEHADTNGPVEMFLFDQANPGTFSVAFGGADAPAIDALMNVSQPAPGVIEFYRVFPGYSASGELVPYTFRKRFEFREGEYMFRLSLGVESSRPELVRTNNGNFAYTLQLGPQIGPELLTQSKSQRGADWRKIIVWENNKRRVINTKNRPVFAEKAPTWVAMTSKYFALVAIPDAPSHAVTYINTTVDGFPGETSMIFSRQPLSASAQTDVFHIYAGPKSNRELARYDNTLRNSFGRTGDQLEAAMEGRGILSWLETLLKWGMNLFYGMVGNYGVAIILLTLLVRIIMFPLTFKGSKSTAKMQEMQPLINELREKYKNNPQRLNKEMAEFYKTNGSPLAGCLPNLLQLPIFIAMYSLFNNHFDLRGAMFIPGWITDLSMPDVIYAFAEPINLVVWQLTAIRGLPIIYLVSQLLFGVFMQQPATAPGQSQTQMKLMMYGMPIFLFFVLYHVPSGLLVYWIASNVLAIGQQLIIKRMMHKHQAEIIAESRSGGPKLVEPKNGKAGKIKR